MENSRKIYDQCIDINHENFLIDKIFKVKCDHPFWENKLLRMIKDAYLMFDDYRLIFSQYYFFYENIANFLYAITTNLKNYYYKSELEKLISNLSSSNESIDAHHEIFKRFLHARLDNNPDNVQSKFFSQEFFDEYLKVCFAGDVVVSASALLVTNAFILPRLYKIFSEGLVDLKLAEDECLSLNLNMKCNDHLLETLTDIVMDFHGEVGWEERCEYGVNLALSLWAKFLNDLLKVIESKRLDWIVHRVNGRDGSGVIFYKDVNLYFDTIKCGIDKFYPHHGNDTDVNFLVTKPKFKFDVLDAMYVIIPVAKMNEYHKHAHEAIALIVRGSGEVRLNNYIVHVVSGDTVHIPRWCAHQIINSGDENLEIFYVTDYGLTKNLWKDEKNSNIQGGGDF